MQITEVEAIRIAMRFLESNGYVVLPTDHRGVIDPGKPPLYCGGAERCEGHWTVLFAPPRPEGRVAPLPLTTVRVDGATGKAEFLTQ
jgi:hypothetical protein